MNASPLPFFAKLPFGLPAFLARRPITGQLRRLGFIFTAFMLAIALQVFSSNRSSSQATAYMAAAGEMRMLSQRLAKAASQALQGHPQAFTQLQEASATFALLLGNLKAGGEVAGVLVPASPAAVAPALAHLGELWQPTERDAAALLAQERSLIELGRYVTVIDNNNAVLLELTEQLAALKLQAGSGAREIAAANQLVMLTQRIAKNASTLLVGAEITPEVAFMLGKDTNAFRDLLQGLAHGSESLRLSGRNDADSREKLLALESAFQDYQKASAAILGNLQPLAQAKQAGSRIFRESDDLLRATDGLASTYQQVLSDRLAANLLLAICCALAIATLALMLKLYLAESRRRTAEAEAMRQVSETLNRTNQEALLRLMNELGDLADGDLTVTATVSEEITGAIADSINYAIEELRILVSRINDAVVRVTQSTEIARQTSSELLEAANRQSWEIEAVGSSALDMARAISSVSESASRSVDVAHQSLSAAEQGTQAVHDAIKGMNGIRSQIQETAKRLKRLGESSQEIGDIVDLISEITEQTNVLALNAAIQAASAGEAGRGFSVVAEEVQRLAERSAEATRQIAGIVRTIQSDTHDAVSAMEASTQGVVEGARLTDAAGQALADIGRVSRDLAALIGAISQSTEHQAQAATAVASRMQDILGITEQAMEGSQRTAAAVDELTTLARELKGSVAGFKLK